LPDRTGSVQHPEKLYAGRLKRAIHGNRLPPRVRFDGQRREQGRTTMNGALSLAELDDRIAVLRDNIRQLVEQAAGASGSLNEEGAADRIAQQTDELNKLILERDSRAKK
jgi:uncharacterized small protein (DUF1192 family)